MQARVQTDGNTFKGGWQFQPSGVIRTGRNASKVEYPARNRTCDDSSSID
jgi:hypothetical protein